MCKLNKAETHNLTELQIVVAQLLVPTPGKPKDSSKAEYENRGPQTFVLQIRDQITHQPMQGIAVGDIGAKIGYASMD